jgi:hypothetical protein
MQLIWKTKLWQRALLALTIAARDSTLRCRFDGKGKGRKHNALGKLILI